MTLVTRELTVTVPSGATMTVNVPADLDVELTKIALEAVLGTLVALSLAQNERLKRAHLINFASGVASLAELTVKKISFSNQTADNDTAHIIENLLRSLPKGKKEDS